MPGRNAPPARSYLAIMDDILSDAMFQSNLVNPEFLLKLADHV
jgi:hypothetical protein